MSLDNQYLGRVEIGRFKLLLPKSVGFSYRRLTTIGMQVAQQPEIHLLNLNEYMIGSLRCVVTAEMIEVARRILTALVDRVLGEAAHLPELVT